MRNTLLLKFALVSIVGVCFFALSEKANGPRLEVIPFPGFLAAADQLHEEGDAGPGGLADELLVPLSPPGEIHERLWQRLVDRTISPGDGGTLQVWERRLSQKLVPLDPEERALLWSVTMEPNYPEGLRDRLLRILDMSAPGPTDLASVVRKGVRSTAWEAAIRMGRRGYLEDVGVLEEAVREWRGWGRQYPILGLVFLGSEASAPLLREAAQDTSPSVRRHVALALGELGDLRDGDLLNAIARQQPDPATLRAVLHAKQRLQERHVPAL
jgi:hypothetical protein